MVRRPDTVRRRWSGAVQPDLFSSPARPASPAPAARPSSAPVSSEAVERVRLAIAEVVSCFEARQAEAVAAKDHFAAAPRLSSAEVVELVELARRFAFKREEP